MLYTTEYEVEVLEEGKKPDEKDKKSFTFDKFMDDILIREGKSEKTKDASEQEKKQLLAESQELDRIRRRWRERYADSPHSRLRIKR